MALKAKIRDVGHERDIDNGDGSTTTVDLSLQGRFFVVADYYDDADPNVILETQTFDLPVEMSVEDAQERIKTYGQRVRDARVRVTQLRSYVGAVIALD